MKTEMKNTLIVALIAALTVSAQDEIQQPRTHWGAAGEMPAARKGRPDMHKRMLEKFDLDKDGKLSPEEHKALRDAAPRFRGERGEKNRKAFMDKFDADKDGKLNEAEKEAAKAKCRTNEKRSPRGKRPAAPTTFEL